ncbi:MAG: cysteine--tRNA ligase, partial [Desulfobacterales bacterium]
DWGNVRPSWHIQCAALSMKYLGDNYDIYASSRELLFPHHENVNAIAAAVTGKPLARYWIHCDRILVEGKKVDENDHGVTLDDLARMGYSGRVIRYWLFSTHYRKPIAFAPDRLDNARRSLERLARCIDTLQRIRAGRPYPELDQLLYDIKHGFVSAMDDDLNISAAMAALFNMVKKINILAAGKQIDPQGASRILDTFRRIDAVLGFLDFGPSVVDPAIQDLIQARERARRKKDWERADKLREQLRARGILVRDQTTIQPIGH